MSVSDHHFQREDRSLLWQRIAGHVATHPEVLVKALATLDRWEAWGRVHPAPIQEWRKRIHAAQANPTEFESLIAFLSAPNHDSEPIKSCSPFMGLITDTSPLPS